jgi:hypothetical protein
MTHRRSKDSLLKRQIRGLIFTNARQDRQRAETVNMLSSSEIVSALAGPVEPELCDVPQVVKGEVLVDSRGQGSFQVISIEKGRG